MRKPTRIVVSDPDPTTCQQATDYLVQRGYEVAQFPTISETISNLKTSPADIVLLSLEINELDGTAIIKEAKKKNSEVSIILTGTPGSIITNENLLMFGGYEYVLKPLRADVLHAVVDQRLNQQHLYRICSALSATLDVAEALNLILETALREIGANQCAILLKNGRPDSLKIEAAKGWSEEIVGTIHSIDDTSIINLVLANGEPIVLQGGFAQLPFIPESVARDIKSSIYAPIRIGGTTIGVLNINRLTTTTPFRQSDLRTVEIIALQAATAIQNARAHYHALQRQKLKQELDLARSIQQNLLPEIPPYEQYAEIIARNIPAQMVGGDFFDFIELGPKRFGLMVGDVATKGVPGALLMVRAISSFRSLATASKSPGQVLQELNNDLVTHSARGMYVTAIYAIFDFHERVLSFANAGHPRLLLRRSGSEILEPTDVYSGIPLGVLEDFTYETTGISLKTGDMAFLYTDGITEARNPDKEEFSLDRLTAIVETAPPSVSEISDRVLNELVSFTAGWPQHDDITMVAVGIKNANKEKFDTSRSQSPLSDKSCMTGLSSPS